MLLFIPLKVTLKKEGKPILNRFMLQKGKKEKKN